MDKRAWVAIAGAVFGCLGAVYLLVAPSPKLPNGVADGTYRNACCESLVLRNGTMSFGSFQVSYVVETDKAGAYGRTNMSGLSLLLGFLPTGVNTR